MSREITRKGVRYLINNEGTEAAVVGIRKKEIEDLIIPDKIDEIPVTGIMPQAFIHNWTIKTVSLPEAIEVIPNAVFYCCGNLEAVELRGENPDGNKTVRLKYYSFYRCNKLKAIKGKRRLIVDSAAIVDCESLIT